MQHTTPCPSQCEVLKKQILCTAVLSALALMSGAASAATDGTITDQNGFANIGLNGTNAADISFENAGKTGIEPTESLTIKGNNNKNVVFKAKDVLKVTGTQSALKRFALYDVQNLTLEGTQHAVVVDSGNTILNLGRNGFDGDFKGDQSHLKTLTLKAGNDGHALYVKTGNQWTQDDDIDAAPNKADVRIFAENTVLESTGKPAVMIQGNWDATNGRYFTHPDVEFVDVEGVKQTLTIKGGEYSIDARHGATMTVRAEEVYLEGGVHVSKNAKVDLGYRDKDRFPSNWEDGFTETNEDGSIDPEEDKKTEILEKVTVTAKGGKAALEFDNGGLLSIGAKDVYINAANGTAISVDTTGDNYASDHSVVDVYARDNLVINGDIKVDTTEGIGKEGYINISAGDEDHVGTVIINGDIDLKTTKENAQAVNIILEGANSSFTGKINTSIVDNSPSTVALFARKDTNDAPKGTNVAIRNGATLNATGDSSITNIDADGGVINAGQSKVEIDKLNTGAGGTTIKSTDPKANQIAIDSNVGNGKIDVEVDLTNNTTFNGKDEELRKALDGMIAAKSNQNPNKVSITATGNMTDMTVDKDLSTNEVTGGQVTTSEVLLSLNDIASNQMLAWRAQINDVSKRMGDLRTYDTESGGWVRMFGSRSEYGDRNMDNKSTTIQVGTDRRVAGNGYVGLTAHYSEGDGDLVNGSTENKAFGFGVYGGWMADDGQFVDVILKRTRMDTDFKLKYATGTESNGDFKTWGTSLAVEYGWRLPYKSTAFWLEPQAEVTYGHLEGVDYTTSAGVNAHQKGMDSLVGRLGLALGYTKDANTVYAKASVAHEFEGESSATMRSGSSLTLEQDIGGTWGEVALGGTVRLNKSIAAYGEFQTAFGSPVKTPYQWNIGMRYMW